MAQEDDTGPALWEALVSGAQAFIFDLEGVIVDTADLWGDSNEELLRRHGVAYERGQISHLLNGASMREGAAVFKDMHDLEGTVDELAAERAQVACEIFRAHPCEPMPGTMGFIEALGPRLRKCVATSAPPDILALIDAQHGIDRLFEGCVYSSSQVGHVPKSEPSLFLHAARHLGVRPDACVVVEDSPMGIEGAKRAGMRAVALSTTHDASLLGEADVIVASLLGLAPVP
jgi:HAD superfamily hydrolase (TIGR01509 family)